VTPEADGPPERKAQELGQNRPVFGAVSLQKLFFKTVSIPDLAVRRDVRERV
jgi:hypothetical protein